jgi:hypothetical protein
MKIFMLDTQLLRTVVSVAIRAESVMDTQCTAAMTTCTVLDLLHVSSTAKDGDSLYFGLVTVDEIVLCTIFFCENGWA